MGYYSFPVVVAILLVLAGTAGAQSDEAIGGDMGVYRIHCNVEGAKVFFDDDYKGEIDEGILDVPVYVTGTPYRTFTIEKEGYKDYSGILGSVPGKGQIIHIYAKLSALPIVEYGTLHLLVSPSLSAIVYDGEDAGPVPPNGILIIRDVLPGNHIIKVSKEGYVTQTLDVFIEKNEVKKVSVTLQEAVTAPLTIQSEPSGASAYLDGQVVGTTPLTLPDVAVGEHTILVSKEGYNDFSQTLSVPVEGATISADLPPATQSGRAGLSPVVLLGMLAAGAFLALRRT